MRILKPKLKPTAKDKARIEAQNILACIRDYRRCGKRLAMALVDEAHRLYCESNFGGDGECSLDDVDLLKAIADSIQRDYGIRPTTHRELEERCRAAVEKAIAACTAVGK